MHYTLSRILPYLCAPRIIFTNMTIDHFYIKTARIYNIYCPWVTACYLATTKFPSLLSNMWNISNFLALRKKYILFYLIRLYITDSFTINIWKNMKIKTYWFTSRRQNVQVSCDEMCDLPYNRNSEYITVIPVLRLLSMVIIGNYFWPRKT